VSEDGLAALQALIDRSVRTATPAVADSVAYPERQMTAAELVDFVRQARMIAMATVGPTGQPHIAPVHAELDGTTLVFERKRIEFPAQAREELEALVVADGPVRASELPGLLDDEGRLVLARRLIREGFLRRSAADA